MSGSKDDMHLRLAGSNLTLCGKSLDSVGIETFTETEFWDGGPCLACIRKRFEGRLVDQSAKLRVAMPKK